MTRLRHTKYMQSIKKISAKSEAKLYETILNIEAEKLLYFVLAYPQKVVIVKSGEKILRSVSWVMSSLTAEEMRVFMLYRKARI